MYNSPPGPKTRNIPANGDFRFCLTLNRFDNVAPFADNAPNEIVGGEHLQGDIVRTRETCFLLHYLENATTRLRAVLRITVDHDDVLIRS